MSGRAFIIATAMAGSGSAWEAGSAAAAATRERRQGRQDGAKGPILPPLAIAYAKELFR